MADEYQLAGIAFVEIDGNGNRVLRAIDEATIDSVEAVATFTDPAGVDHTGEIADLADLPGFSVSDDGTLVVDNPSDVDFGSNLTVTDNGDGTATVVLSDSPSVTDFTATNSLTDPAGVTHTGELADIDDVGGGSGSGDIATVTVASSGSSFSADFTCDGTDDQTTINNAINALPAGGGTVVLTEGTFNLSGAITDQSKNGVWLRGQGDATLLQLGTVQANVIEFTSVDDTIISDLRINGNGANVADGGDRENQCGIYGTALNRCLIQNVSIIDTYYSNIRIGDGGSTVYALTVADCYLETTRGGSDNVADGISTLGRQGGTFERIILRDNYIIDTNHDFVEISSGNDVVHIMNNVCYSERPAAGGIGPHPGTNGVESEATDEIVIVGNYVSLPNLDSSSGSTGGIAANCRQMTVIGNIVQDVGDSASTQQFNGISVDNIHSTNGGPSVIVGNMVDNVFGNGIRAGGEDCTVVGNSIQGSSEYGIKVNSNAARETIVGNTVNNSGTATYDVESGATEIVFEGNQPRRMAASGTVTLSSGVATVDTGISTSETATFMLALGPGTADADVGGDIRADSGTGTYVVDIEETDTSVGNPDVAYDVKRVR